MTEDDFERLYIPKRARVRILTLADAVKRKLMERSKLSSPDNFSGEDNPNKENNEKEKVTSGTDFTERPLQTFTRKKIASIISYVNMNSVL